MKKKTPIQWDPARPLPKKKEMFCRLYAGEHWGDPAAAARNAGFSDEPEAVEKLLDDQAIAGRIRYLRRQLADHTIADQAWIKRCFVEIIKNADKPADKLRALATLYRTLAGSKKPEPDQEADGGFFFDDEEI